MGEIDSVEDKIAKVRLDYLTKLKEELKDMMPMMGYTRKNFATYLEMCPTSFARFLNTPSAGVLKGRLLKIERFIDKARLHLKKEQQEVWNNYQKMLKERHPRGKKISKKRRKIAR